MPVTVILLYELSLCMTAFVTIPLFEGRTLPKLDANFPLVRQSVLLTTSISTSNISKMKCVVFEHTVLFLLFV